MSHQVEQNERFSPASKWTSARVGRGLLLLVCLMLPLNGSLSCFTMPAAPPAWRLVWSDEDQMDPLLTALNGPRKSAAEVGGTMSFSTTRLVLTTRISPAVRLSSKQSKRPMPRLKIYHEITPRCVS